MLCTSSNVFGGKISGTWIFKSQSMIPRLIQSRGPSPKKFIYGHRLLRLEVFRSLLQHHDDGFSFLVLNGDGVLAYRRHGTHQMSRVAVREKGAGQERDRQQKRNSLFQHMSP